MKYQKRRYWKYRVYETLLYSTGIFPIKSGRWQLLSIDDGGLLTIHEGYCWDGPSGPTFDTKNFMRGSLVHDALYQLMREGHIDRSNRKAADKLLVQMCKTDGMSTLRATWVYRGVRRGGKGAAKHDILTAP